MSRQYSFIFVLVFELFFLPLKLHIWPTEEVCDLSEAHTRKTINQRRDSRCDALKETRFSERAWGRDPRRQTPSSPFRDTTRIVSLPKSWSSCGKPDTCWSCCRFGSSHELLPEMQKSGKSTKRMDMFFSNLGDPWPPWCQCQSSVAASWLTAVFFLTKQGQRSHYVIGSHRLLIVHTSSHWHIYYAKEAEKTRTVICWVAQNWFTITSQNWDI